MITCFLCDKCHQGLDAEPLAVADGDGAVIPVGEVSCPRKAQPCCSFSFTQGGFTLTKQACHLCQYLIILAVIATVMGLRRLLNGKEFACELCKYIHI